MLAIRIAETDPARAETRHRWLEAHQAYLRSGGITVLQSGPLFEADTQYGALLVADVGDLADLQRFSDADPFVVHGVYKRITLLRWSRTIDQN